MLGTIHIVTEGSRTWFHTGGWRTQVASVASGEGVVLESTTPGLAGFRFTVTTVEGARVLVLDDGQRSYTFQEGEWAAPVVKVRDAEASASPERGD